MTIPDSSSTDIESLRSTFKGDIVLPSDEQYQAAIHRWAVNAQKPAAAVLYVKNEADIATALEYAEDNKVDFAVRGGGHSSSGASSSDGGIVIDLSRYHNTVRVDPETRCAYVGGGATWDDVNNATAEFGLACPGGTVGETGVGGLTLGGGLGFISGMHGLVVDNVVGATVLLADGTSVKCGPAYSSTRHGGTEASDDEHKDLFFAIRGGGGNFGIVTEFVLQLHPQPSQVFSGMLGWPITSDTDETYLKVIEECEKFQMRPKEGEEALWVMYAGMKLPGSSGPTLLVTPYWNGTEAEGRERFKDFLELNPTMNTTKSMTYAQTAHILPTKHGLNRYQSPCNLSLPLSQVAPSILSTLNSHIASQRLPKVQPLVMLELFDTAKIESVPSSAMAFHRRDWQGAYSGALAYGWDAHTDMSGATGDKAEQASDVGKVEEMREARTMIREMADAVAGRTPGEGAGEMTYGNYISEASDAKTSKNVFGPNYPRLQRVKAKYDPENMFGKWFPIQPTSADT